MQFSKFNFLEILEVVFFNKNMIVIFFSIYKTGV